MLLAGDIGGTKTALGLYQLDGSEDGLSEVVHDVDDLERRERGGAEAEEVLEPQLARFVPGQEIVPLGRITLRPKNGIRMRVNPA